MLCDVTLCLSYLHSSVCMCFVTYLAAGHLSENDVISLSRKHFCALGLYRARVRAKVRVKVRERVRTRVRARVSFSFRVRVEAWVRVSGNTFKYVFGKTPIRTSVIDSFCQATPLLAYPKLRLN